MPPTTTVPALRTYAAAIIAIQRRIYAAHGYPYFTGGEADLNVCGLRAKGRRPDSFDDAILVSTMLGGSPYVLLIPATTEPGGRVLRNPTNPNGVARVVPGFYRGVWTVGTRSDGRPAFAQVGPFKVQRDNDRDAVYDENAPTSSGVFGIHLHGPAVDGLDHVGNLSAACQVPRYARDFDDVYALGRLQVARRGSPSVSYALIDEVEDPDAGILIALAQASPRP